MEAVFDYQRLTPSRVRAIAALIGGNRQKAKEFTEATVDRLARLISDTQAVDASLLEEAFLIAIETRKIFSAANLNIWDFFPRPESRSLLGHVFIGAVEGMPLREIIETARFSSVNRGGRLFFDPKEFAEQRQKLAAAM